MEFLKTWIPSGSEVIRQAESFSKIRATGDPRNPEPLYASIFSERAERTANPAQTTGFFWGEMGVLMRGG
jgi:hypothetical protein